MSHFFAYPQIILNFSLFLCFISILNFHQKNTTIAIIALLLSAFGIRFFMIAYYPFLNDWDERFHALVAKNMVEHPFVPMLISNPVLPYNYKDWCCNHIWLHKQPLFLWQMAISIKLFGANVIAMRLPSALMGTIQVLFIYRIGKILKDNQTGYYSALFYSVSFFALQLTAGVADMDHIRVAFGFYVCASFWALAEYLKSKRTGWAIWVGVFSGAAVLNMWLAGLIVYGSWALVILYQSHFKVVNLVTENKREVLWLILSFVVSLIVFIPWQVYIANYFPLESAYEAQWNQRHITEALENHTGPWYYYINQLPLQFGRIFSYLIPFALLSLFVKPKPDKALLLALLFCLIVSYLFFSIIVQTRMPSYVYMSHFIIWIGFGSLFSLTMDHLAINRFSNFYPYVKSLAIFAICLLGILKINAIVTSELLRDQVIDLNAYLSKKNHNTEIYKNLNQLVPKDYVVFNCSSFENVEAMFYSDHIAYHWYPTETQLDSLIKSGVKVAAFESHKEYMLPAYFEAHPEILIIHAQLY